MVVSKLFVHEFEIFVIAIDPAQVFAIVIPCRLKPLITAVLVVTVRQVAWLGYNRLVR